TRTAEAIADNKPAEALKVVDDLIGRGQDLRNFCRDLLSFFRDLLVFKMAGDAENLLDTAILSRDELNKNSAPFSESDLIRFFNSLSETESKLREATQPRYVLEIGLIKLIEMRRVSSIETLLERLAKIENVLVDGNFPIEVSNQEKSIEPTAEKKTLTVDFPLEEVPFSVRQNSNSEFQVQNQQISQPTNNEQQTTNNEQRANTKALDLIESMPIKFPPITAEELEHIEDSWLDDAFERELQMLGDDLCPIPNASKIVEVLLGENFTNQVSANIETSNGSPATAFAPAKETVAFVPPGYETEISEEIPELPENPTEEQLWQYAEHHPLVKKALRIFRGKIVEVRQLKGESQNR
ncbi:MAG: hypothetical protein M3Q33_09105, partial [Acidobacteriota bacterium]|nr:hypothetical protein [Acidobacteriota bacterium]